MSASHSIEVVPSFSYTRREEAWPGFIFAPLLMRHGPPPDGIKWYGEQRRLHVRGAEARKWVETIVEDCEAAVFTSPFLSHFKTGYKQMLARKIKNDFIRWIRDAK